MDNQMKRYLRGHSEPVEFGVHHSPSTQTPKLSELCPFGVLWRLHCIGVIDEIIGHWWLNSVSKLFSPPCLKVWEVGLNVPPLVNPKGNQSWIFIRRTDAEAETPNFDHLMWGADSLERPWCWVRLKARGEGGGRGWYGWMASPTQWTWVWANSRRLQMTGKPGVLQSTELQRVGHDWTTTTTITGWFPILKGFPKVPSLA